MKKYEVSRDEMAACAQELLTLPGRVWTFTGTLGTGKTTLVQEMLAQLGVQGPIQSPTYTYVSVYQTAQGKTVYHFDLYRLSSYDEFIQAGFDEYLYDEQALCFIEWPEIVKQHLPPHSTSVTLEYGSDGNRVVDVVLN